MYYTYNHGHCIPHLLFPVRLLAEWLLVFVLVRLQDSRCMGLGSVSWGLSILVISHVAHSLWLVHLCCFSYTFVYLVCNKCLIIMAQMFFLISTSLCWHF